MPLISRPDLRSLAPLVLAGALAAPSAARAQALPPAPKVDLGGATIDMKLQLPDPDEEGSYIETSAEKVLDYMDLASCTCGDSALFQVQFELDNAPATIPSGSEEVDIWVGTGCAVKDLDQQRNLCIEEPSIAEVDDLKQQPEKLISVRDLVGPVDRSQSCAREDEQERQVYAIIDEANDGFDSDTDYQKDLKIKTDTQPPPAPLNAKASGSEGLVRVTWDLPESRSEDIETFQVLCARVDDPSDTSEFGGFDAQYWTSRQACGSDADGVCPRRVSGASQRTAAGGPDGGADGGADEADAGAGGADAGVSGECSTDLPPGLANLDERYLCGEAGSSATKAEAEGLENGVAYRIVLLAIDDARNVTALDLGTATPKRVKDFWEDYKDAGGQAKGGCSVGQAGLGGGIGLGLGLAIALVIRSRRRRRAGAAAGGALLLALALSPRPAAAQPWWEGDGEQVAEQAGPAQPRWGLEIKLGPYVPDVDGEFDGGEPGPFERMFGDGPFLMTQLTLDRYFLYPMGQLGLTATAGFLTRSANAFEEDAAGNPIVGDNGKPKRSIGDTTRFSLIPASLGLVYRFTSIDDRFRIPVVPYGRAGLSYYTWWVTKPGGGVAVADGEKARGGSLGWQATVGLAVRLERIDPDTEISLRSELGIEHAGLVAEYTYAVVDGFGSGEKLAVGDGTWLAGIDFEF